MKRSNGLSRNAHAAGLALFLSAASLAAAACSTGAKPGTAAADAPPSAQSSHPVHADRLHATMRGFDAAVRTKVPAETDQHDRWEGVFPKIADAAAELEASAKDLAGHVPGKLELPDRARFATLAKSLETRAGELKEAAARGDADGVELARESLGHACRDCHERFRPDSPGVPDAFRR